AGRIKLESKPLETMNLVDESLKIVKLQAQQKKITIRYDVTKAPFKFIGDIVRLKQVIVNLIMNSIKYTPNEKEIKFEIKLVNKITLPDARYTFYPSNYDISDFRKDREMLEFSVED